jgi:hypothetical protein
MLTDKMACIAFAILRGKTVYREISGVRSGGWVRGRGSSKSQGGIGIEGDQEVMRRKAD